MSTTADTKSSAVPEVEPESAVHPSEHTHGLDLDEKAVVADYKADAMEAETAELNMTVLEAVRQYPMATWWAFVMSCTIVSCLYLLHLSLFPR